MLGSRMVRAGLRRAVVALAALGLLLALPGAALAAPPNITDPYLDPSLPLPPEGGTVEVHAQIDADAEPVTATALISGPTSYSVALSTAFGGATSGLVTIPANSSANPVEWVVQIRAVDGNGESSTQTVGVVTVEGNPFDEPPIVWDASATPTTVPSGGGTVALAVSATDTRGISEVSADVTRPDGTHVVVPLEPVGGDRFTGTYAAPANTGTTAQAYLVTFIATDDIGQQSTTAVGFAVAAPAPPPSTGTLVVHPGTLRFGDVKVGRTATRWLTVKHTGPRSAKPISGTVTSSGAPFAVVGTSTFTLRPGQSKAFRVTFHPTTPGRRTGHIAVRRADGGRPTLGVAAEGRGTCAPRKACVGR